MRGGGVGKGEAAMAVEGEARASESSLAEERPSKSSAAESLRLSCGTCCGLSGG